MLFETVLPISVNFYTNGTIIDMLIIIPRIIFSQKTAQSSEKSLGIDIRQAGAGTPALPQVV